MGLHVCLQRYLSCHQFWNEYPNCSYMFMTEDPYIIDIEVTVTINSITGLCDPPSLVLEHDSTFEHFRDLAFQVPVLIILNFNLLLFYRSTTYLIH